MNKTTTGHETITTKMTVTSKVKGLLSEFMTEIEVVNEGGGEFLSIAHCGNSISIEPENWPHIKAAIDLMLAQIKIREEIKKP